MFKGSESWCTAPDLVRRLSKIMLGRAQHGAGQEVVLDLMANSRNSTTKGFSQARRGPSGSMTSLAAVIHLVS